MCYFRTDTESEMLRLASESLGSASLAKVATSELLEPLARAESESNSIILKEYENYKKRNPL